MNFGLTPEQFALLTSLVIGPLKKQKARVWIFGSRARGDQKKFSDVDVLFELTSGHSMSGAEISLIKEQIEESRIPFKVDLVEWKDLAESYKQHILKERVEV